MSRSLCVLFLGVLTDQSDLGIFILEKSPQTHEIQVGGHKKNGVAGVIFIELVPYLLGEEGEAGVICMLEGRYIWKAPQSQLQVTIGFFGHVKCKVGMHSI